MNFETLDVDEAIEGFGTERRRRVIELLERDGSSTVGELATEIAAGENEVALEAVTGPQRQRVYVPLYQDQLDKLEEVGAIEWDKDRGTVNRGPAFEHAAKVLETLRELCSDDPDGGDDLEAEPAEDVTLDQFAPAEGSR